MARCSDIRDVFVEVRRGLMYIIKIIMEGNGLKSSFYSTSINGNFW